MIKTKKSADAAQSDGPQSEPLTTTEEPVAEAAVAIVAAPPVFADNEEHPSAGGSYIRLPDGSLIEDKES